MTTGSQSPSGYTTTNSNTSTQPWSVQQPYLQDIFGQAKNLYQNQQPQYYPNSTFSPQTPQQSIGLSDTAALAQLLMNGGFLNNTLNATNYFTTGQATAQDPTLANLIALTQSGNYGLPGSNPGATGLLNFASGAGVNPGEALANAPGYGTLGNFASGMFVNPYAVTSGNPGANSLNQFASGQLTNPYAAVAGNPGSQGLSPFASGMLTNPYAAVAGNPGSWSLAPFASGELTNPYAAVAGNPGSRSLAPFASGMFNNPSAYLGGAGTLENFASGALNPANAAISNNPGSDALRYFASGSATDPLLSSVAQSTLANVVPSIESQFIQGGGLSGPAAAYATSQGASAALAPILSNALLQEQQNQLTAGGALQNTYANALLQGQQNQYGAGGQLASLYASGLGQGFSNQLAAGGQLQGAYSQALQNQQANQLAAGGQLQGTYAQALQNQQANQLAASGQLQGAYGQALQNQQANQLGAGNTLANLFGNTLLGQQQMQSSAANSLTNDYLNTLLQQQNMQYGATGQLAQNALAGQGLLNTAGANAANAYGADLQKQLQAIGLAPQTTASALSLPAAEYSAGATQQQLNQQQLNDLINRWNYEQTLPYQQLNQYLGTVQGNYGGQGSSSVSQPYYINQPANLLSGGLGGAALGKELLGPSGFDLLGGGAAGVIGGALGLLGGLIPSDRRLKTDIKRLATAPNGLPIYRFRFKGGHETHIGLMADDVAKLHPHAVHEGPFGYYTVDYAEALKPCDKLREAD